MRRNVVFAPIGVLALTIGLSSDAPMPPTEPQGAASSTAAPTGEPWDSELPSLPLGAPGLPESRIVERLAPGVTLTRIARGRPSPKEHWTLGIGVPVGDGEPRPVPGGETAALGTRAHAEDVARKLRAAGWSPRIEAVYGPRFTDVAGGLLGYVVRVGSYRSKDETAADLARLTDKGFAAAPRYTAHDGRPTTGPWRVQVLAVDPAQFSGSLVSTVGNHVSGRETTSSMAAQLDALAAVNGGFYIVSSKNGTPGDPVGISAVGSGLLSEASNGRTALVLPANGRRVQIGELTTAARVRASDGATREVDGFNRSPGLIRNCGGGGGDLPTQAPKHDVTCTDANELVVFTPEFGSKTPGGDGLEAVLDRAGRVTKLRPPGGPVPVGVTVVRSTGAATGWLSDHAVPGTTLRIQPSLRDERGRWVPTRPGLSVVSGGPRLVRHGRVWVNVRANGFVHDDNPAFYYWAAIRRHPRTMAGVDQHGRLLFVAVDGRVPGYSEGLTILEAARLMEALGATEALGLDGGRSTTMVARGNVVNTPPSGERTVGDAIALVPRPGRAADEHVATVAAIG